MQFIKDNLAFAAPLDLLNNTNDLCNKMVEMFLDLSVTQDPMMDSAYWVYLPSAELQ